MNGLKNLLGRAWAAAVVVSERVLLGAAVLGCLTVLGLPLAAFAGLPLALSPLLGVVVVVLASKW